jgi:3-hydroxyisobutyrate dehydrogenase
MTPASTVGYIGLGDMGGPVCTRLLLAGFATSVYDISPARVEAFASKGADAAATPLGVVRRADTVFVCVVNDEQVLDVFFGDAGLAAGLDPTKIVAVNSSVRPQTMRDIAADPRLNGAIVIDAPVSGSRPAAQSGTLTVIAGGDASGLERIRPYLEAFSSHVFHVGPVGSAQALKIANNMLLHMNHLVALETLRFARSQQIDERVLIDVANVSTGRSWVTETWGLIDQMMVDHPQAGTPSIYPLMSKELWNAVVISRQCSISLPLTALGTQLSQTYFEERERDLDGNSVAPPV